MKELSLHTLDIIQNSITAGATRVDLMLTEEDHTLTISVKDNGCGMSPEMLARVMDPFTTTRTTRKIGLGIPLFRMAAEQTGGSFSIESTPGRGTLVTAVLHTDHIDCMPLGDIAATLALTIQGAPEVELYYTHRSEGRSFHLDTPQLREILGSDVSLAEPEVILWLQDYVREQESLLTTSH